MASASDKELDSNGKLVDSFRRDHAGTIFEVFSNQKTFLGKTYSVLLARVWNGRQKTFEVLEVCNNRASCWDGSPNPLPNLVPDASDSLRKEVDDFLQQRNRAIQDIPRIPMGALVRVKTGKSAGVIGKVFWVKETRAGLSTPTESSFEKDKNGLYKSVVWSDTRELEVLLTSVPRSNSKSLIQLIRYMTHLYAWAQRLNLSFQEMWEKSLAHPILLLLMMVYPDGVPSEYGTLFDLLQKIESDRVLSKYLLEIVEKAHAIYFTMNDFSTNVRGMISVTFPLEEVI